MWQWHVIAHSKPQMISSCEPRKVPGFAGRDQNQYYCGSMGLYDLYGFRFLNWWPSPNVDICSVIQLLAARDPRKNMNNLEPNQHGDDNGWLKLVKLDDTRLTRHRKSVLFQSNCLYCRSFLFLSQCWAAMSADPRLQGAHACGFQGGLGRDICYKCSTVSREQMVGPRVEFRKNNLWKTDGVSKLFDFGSLLRRIGPNRLICFLFLQWF